MEERITLLAKDFEDYLNCCIVSEQEIEFMKSFVGFLTNGHIELEISTKVECVTAERKKE